MNESHEHLDNRVFRRRTLVVAGVLLLTALAVYLLFRLRNLLFMVFVALFIAVAIEPAVHFLEKRGWRRGLATGLVFVVVFLLIVAFLALLVPLFVNQFNDLLDALPGYIESVSSNLNEWFNLDISTDTLQQEAAGLPDIIVGAGGTILGGVVSVTTGIFSFLFFVTTVALFSFYMVAELPKLQRTVLSTMRPDRQRDALHIWDVAVEKMGGYIYSRLILSLLSGTLTALFLTILGVPFAVSLGIWVGVLSQFIPVVGTYLAAILPAVVALSSGGLGTMLWVILYFLAYQQVENYLIAPRITQRTMEIHPAVSIAAIIIGSALFGPLGVILALPMTGIIQALISEARSHHAVILDSGHESEHAT
ncbi:MAG: AI-2E family transporter [Acidimicrobiia bacterium]